MINTIASVFFFGVLGYVSWTVYREYKQETTGTTYDRVWAAFKDSGTILWNKFIIVLAAVIAQLDNVADFFNMPELKNYINLALSNPKTVAIVMLGISSLTIVVRMRKGSNDPLR